MDKLKDSPHGIGDSFRGKGTAVYDLKYLVVKIYSRSEKSSPAYSAGYLPKSLCFKVIVITGTSICSNRSRTPGLLSNVKIRVPMVCRTPRAVMLLSSK
jgi:hypothetical protein